MSDEVYPDVFVGDVDDINRADEDGHDFDRIVTLMRSDGFESTTHHRPLIDGKGNHVNDFEKAVDTVREAIRKEERVLVHCAAGRSRAPSVTATALAAERNSSWDEEIEWVEEERGYLHVSPYLREMAWDYLGENPIEGYLNGY